MNSFANKKSLLWMHFGNALTYFELATLFLYFSLGTPEKSFNANWKVTLETVTANWLHHYHRYFLIQIIISSW